MPLAWDRIEKMIDRYERLCNENLREMAALQRTLFEAQSSRDICRRHNYAQQRVQLSRIEDQVLSGFHQLIAIRPEIEESLHEKFDTRTEPIRKKIQSCVQANSKLPADIRTDITRRLDEQSVSAFEDAQFNPYEEEMIRHSQLVDNAQVSQLKEVAREAKEKAASTAKLQQDMQDLEQIFAELNRIVHEQHDIVDSIEDHVEKSAMDVNRGNQELKKAIAHKAARAPVAAAVVGGLAVGGPVGFVAGSAVAGVLAGIGGVVGGIYSGRWFKNAVKRDANVE